LRIWDVEATKEVLVLPDYEQVGAIAYSPDGQRLASAGTAARVWDTATGQKVFSLANQDMPIHYVVYSPHGKRLASCCSANATVKLWTAMDGRELTSYRGHAAGLISLAFSPDGGQLATACQDGTVKIWDITRPQEYLTLDTGTERFNELVFHPDSAHLVTL